jgi:hypothetical protein
MINAHFLAGIGEGDKEKYYAKNVFLKGHGRCL